ncbi:transposase [Azorhizophilus paspali]|uniref:Transposase n=1 Tax=Azorhizophilus paspali TaxID=69963 RepID=A0ABV6SPE7_AZOPA
MDETAQQLIGQVREPLEAVPGHAEREDYEYERADTCNVFVACEPLAGRRTIRVTERRTRADWAHFVRAIADGLLRRRAHYPSHGQPQHPQRQFPVRGIRYGFCENASMNRPGSLGGSLV